MKEILLTLLVGIVAGIIDILPMIKMKLDKYATSSAFVFYLVMPFVIYNLDLLSNLWWLKGGIIALVLALPIIILAAKEKTTNAIPITIMSIVLGTLISITGHFLSLM